jgi:hypothetical protein
MPDFSKETLADMAASNRANIGTGTTGSMHQIEWGTEDAFWRDNYASRPYARADLGYEAYRPAYQYGVQAASQYRGRRWADIEPELERGWEGFRGESKSTWQEIKDAVRDAWDRVTGHTADNPTRVARE